MIWHLESVLNDCTLARFPRQRARSKDISKIIPFQTLSEVRNIFMWSVPVFPVLKRSYFTHTLKHGVQGSSSETSGH